MFQHNIQIPSLDPFQSIILVTETSEEIPSYDYVGRIYREIGERGILEKVQGILVGRPKAWEFDKPQSSEERRAYREKQQKTIVDVVRKYNTGVPIIQNLDFGHTDPQIALPYGKTVTINSGTQKITAEF